MLLQPFDTKQFLAHRRWIVPGSGGSEMSVETTQEKCQRNAFPNGAGRSTTQAPEMQKQSARKITGQNAEKNTRRAGLCRRDQRLK